MSCRPALANLWSGHGKWRACIDMYRHEQQAAPAWQQLCLLLLKNSSVQFTHHQACLVASCRATSRLLAAYMGASDGLKQGACLFRPSRKASYLTPGQMSPVHAASSLLITLTPSQKGSVETRDDSNDLALALARPQSRLTRPQAAVK
jgi:hypothetical protein